MNTISFKILFNCHLIWSEEKSETDMESERKKEIKKERERERDRGTNWEAFGWI